MCEFPDIPDWQYRLRPARAGAPGDELPAPEAGAGLPIARILDARGHFAGWLCGFAIDLKAKRTISTSWTAPSGHLQDADSFAWQVMKRLGGRFVWIMQWHGMRRIYSDCAASVPCVYDPKARLVGSSAAALFSAADYELRLDAKLFAALEVDREGWFPAELTAHHGLYRLLPGHYLDLDSWQAKRFWPRAAIELVDRPDDALDALVENIRAQIAALNTEPRRLAFALTAGRETRMLLACARPWVDQIDFVTVTGADRHRVDTIVASRIARDVGLSYRSLTRVEATDEQKSLFVHRTGHCHGDSNATYHPSVWPIAESHIMISGVGGETARGFLWRAGDRPDTPITAQTICRRFGFAANERLLAAISTWLETLPAMNAQQILDQAFIELRNGSWYGPQFTADPTLQRQAPLLNYPAVELMLSLPDDWKRAGNMADRVIAKYWPELARYPFNSLGPVQDLFLKLRSVLSDPKVVLRKIRKFRT